MATKAPADKSEWLELALMKLLRCQGGAPYALFTHEISISLADTMPVPAPAFVGVTRSGQLIMQIWSGMADRLSYAAGAELLKHEVLHFMFGHLSSRAAGLTKQYGKELCNLAADVLVNQHCDEALLAKEGLPGVTCQTFNVPPDKTWPEYCELLSKNQKAQDYVAKANLRTTLEQVLAAAAKGIPICLEGIDPETADAEMLDQALRAAMAKTSEALQGRQYSNNGRGWSSANVTELVEFLNRKPQIAWSTKIRRLEASCLRTERVPSLVRPSRRHPAHFGRIKQNGLHIWFAVDTSGSMSTEMLEAVGPELRGIHNRGAEITLLHVDASICKQEAYRPGKRVIEMAGRGGTDFSDVFLMLNQQAPRRRPGMLVYYTDGYGGIEQYRKRINTTPAHGTHRTPEGVPLLWLLPEGTLDPKSFRENVAQFGDIAVVPKARVS